MRRSEVQAARVLARQAARAAVLRQHQAARTAGQPARSFRVRILAERDARNVLLTAYAAADVASEFRTSTDRKTASIGTFFALSSCQPTPACALACYVLHNMASGPNSPAAVVKSVENTLAAERDPAGAAWTFCNTGARLATSTRAAVSLRINNGGEAPAAFVAAVARLVPTRLLFSADVTRPGIPDGAMLAWTYTKTADARPDAVVNFPCHGPGQHVERADNASVCQAVGAPLASSPCGRTCFQCFPGGSAPAAGTVVAWGFTKRLDVWTAARAAGIK